MRSRLDLIPTNDGSGPGYGIPAVTLIFAAALLFALSLMMSTLNCELRPVMLTRLGVGLFLMGSLLRFVVVYRAIGYREFRFWGLYFAVDWRGKTCHRGFAIGIRGPKKSWGFGYGGGKLRWQFGKRGTP